MKPWTRWTRYEDAKLQCLCKAGLSDSAIARLLGRSAPQSIRARRLILGLQSGLQSTFRKPKRWNATDDETLRSLHAAGTPDRKISRIIGFCPDVIRVRRQALGLPRVVQWHRLPTDPDKRALYIKLRHYLGAEQAYAELNR